MQEPMALVTILSWVGPWDCSVFSLRGVRRILNRNVLVFLQGVLGTSLVRSVPCKCFAMFCDCSGNVT